MHETITDKAERLAESIWTRFFARASMVLFIPALGLGATLGTSWLDGRVEKIVAAEVATLFALNENRGKEVKELSESSNEKIQELTERVLTLETSAKRGREEREKFQDSAIGKLEAIGSALNAMTATIAALSAKMEAQQREIDRK